MEKIVRGKFAMCVLLRSYKQNKPPLLRRSQGLLLPICYNQAPLRYNSHWLRTSVGRPLLSVHTHYRNGVPHRTFALVVARILRGALKIRYLVLGGAVTGGMTLQKTYEQWRDAMPDWEWLDKVLPDNNQWDSFRGQLINMKDKVAGNMESIEIDPRIVALTSAKYRNMKEWFDRRLEDAIQAAEVEGDPTRTPLANGLQTLTSVFQRVYRGVYLSQPARSNVT